ncbi:GAF and ANTAR domain-containing protein [Bounagaea algeriensis]
MASNRAEAVYAWLAADARSSNEPISNAVLCRTACQHLEVDGASVTLMAPPGGHEPAARAQLRQEPVATSGAASTRLEELHLTLGEGPSTEAFTRAAPILVPDLHESTRRWPGFAPAALARDVVAVFALPLGTSTQTGVLTTHRASPGGLPPRALADMNVLAELAGQLLPAEPAQPLTAETRPAEGCAGERDEVHQAVGVLAVQLGVGLQESFTRLRAHAMSHDLSLAELARQVITREVHLPADPGTDT